MVILFYLYVARIVSLTFLLILFRDFLMFLTPTHIEESVEPLTHLCQATGVWSSEYGDPGCRQDRAFVYRCYIYYIYPLLYSTGGAICIRGCLTTTLTGRSI